MRWRGDVGAMKNEGKVTMNKFWIANPSPDGFIVEDVEGRTLLVCPSEGHGLTPHEQFKVVCQAAAAPDMLEALESVVRAFAPHGTEGLNIKQQAAIGRAMNAIHNARAKEQDHEE